MNIQHEFSVNTRVLVGKNLVDSLGDLIKEHDGNKVFIVTDQGLIRTGIIDRITKILDKAEIKYQLFSEITPDPTSEVLTAGFDVFLQDQFDLIIGIGGGSSIDAAKGIAILDSNGGNIFEYEGANKIQKTKIPIIAIPTTAGTGAEVSASCVITDSENHYKVSIRSPYLCPKIALLDPTLITSLPPLIAASTGMDALTHAIEAYVSTNSSPFTDALALKAIREIAEYLPAFVARRDNLEAASHVLMASTSAGMAFTWARVATVHAISHALGGHCKVPHGIANAMALPIVMEYSLIGNLSKYKEIAKALGQEVTHINNAEGAERAVIAVKKLNQALGIPKTLRELGIELTPEDRQKIAVDALKSGITKCNPRESSLDDLVHLIEKIC